MNLPGNPFCQLLYLSIFLFKANQRFAKQIPLNFNFRSVLIYQIRTIMKNNLLLPVTILITLCWLGS